MMDRQHFGSADAAQLSCCKAKHGILPRSAKHTPLYAGETPLLSSPESGERKRRRTTVDYVALNKRLEAEEAQGGKVSVSVAVASTVDILPTTLPPQ